MQKMEKFVLQVNVAPPHNLQESKELLVPDTTAHLQGIRTPLGQGCSGRIKGPTQCCAGDHNDMPYWCLHLPLYLIIIYIQILPRKAVHKKKCAQYF